ncbi:MAG: OmpA family protein [Planctomycetota bacterium]
MKAIKRMGGLGIFTLFLAWLPSCVTTDYEGIILDKDRQIEALSEEKFQLELEVDDLRASKATWEQKVAEAERRAADLRKELAAKPVTPAKAAPVSDIENDRRALSETLKGRGLEVVERRGQLAIVLPSELTFASGKAELTSGGRGNVDRIAEEVRLRFPEKKISVEGHTDNDPIRKSGFRSNWHLSVERALSVREALERAGIGSDRFNVVGYGEHKPIASNASDTGKKRNRRVEIVLY